MDWNPVITILTSWGGAAALSLALIKFVGQTWVQRSMEKLKAELQVDIRNQTAAIENALAIFKEKELKYYNEKIAVYRSAFVPIIDLVYDFEKAIYKEETISDDTLLDFNRNRLKAHAELALFAPQYVINEWDSLVDFLFDRLEMFKAEGYDPQQALQVWREFRDLGLTFISKMRIDVGLAEGDVTYTGHR